MHPHSLISLQCFQSITHSKTPLIIVNNLTQKGESITFTQQTGSKLLPEMIQKFERFSVADETAGFFKMEFQHHFLFHKLAVSGLSQVHV